MIGVIMHPIDCPECGTRTIPAGQRPKACPTCGHPFDVLDASDY